MTQSLSDLYARKKVLEEAFNALPEKSRWRKNGKGDNLMLELGNVICEIRDFEKAIRHRSITI